MYTYTSIELFILIGMCCWAGRVIGAFVLSSFCEGAYIFMRVHVAFAYVSACICSCIVSNRAQGFVRTTDRSRPGYMVACFAMLAFLSVRICVLPYVHMRTACMNACACRISIRPCPLIAQGRVFLMLFVFDHGSG